MTVVRRLARAAVDEFPLDPDLYDLPPELAVRAGSWRIVGVAEDGNVWEAPATREHVAAALADRRRAAEHEAA